METIDTHSVQLTVQAAALLGIQDFTAECVVIIFKYSHPCSVQVFKHTQDLHVHISQLVKIRKLRKLKICNFSGQSTRTFIYSDTFTKGNVTMPFAKRLYKYKVTVSHLQPGTHLAFLTKYPVVAEVLTHQPIKVDAEV